MPSIRAIPTIYSGVKFRSRLEARWAVAFDALGIAWEYEPEGFDLPSGERYLPDFWLPTFDGGIYAEVKPTGGDTKKAWEFAQAANVRVWLCVGPYDTREYEVVQPDGTSYRGHPNWDQAHGEDRMFSESGMTDSDNWFSEDDFCAGDLNDLCRRAINAAKSHRFGT